VRLHVTGGEYPIRDVTGWDKLQVEQMGSKRKFWCVDPSSQNLWLFKYARENTGEDWAEKIASETAALLCLPHARVELATCQRNRGIISLDFTDRKRRGEFVPGNELLFEIDRSYPQHEYYRVSQHTVDSIIHAISQDFLTPSVVEFFPDGLCPPKALFLGYLLLDALIGNTDRHHENWGLLVKSESGKRAAELAPTFDHASSLGRELDDARINACLAGSRSGSGPSIESYANRARSAIYLRVDDARPLTTLEAFRAFHLYADMASQVWLDKMAQITDDMLCIAVERVPTRVLGAARKKFVCGFLSYNKKRLLDTGAS
jgi:hypothetical protein